MVKWLAAFAALITMSGAAEAHYIWLERNGSDVRAFFGEWEVDLREVSGGTLDRIKSLTAFETDRTKTLTVTRESNHFAVKGGGKGDVRAVEERAPTDDKANGGKTKTVFQAKAGRAETRAVLDLELVPLAEGSDDFVLMLHGAPLAKAEVHVFGPPKWGRELRTDDSGNVAIPTPWAGQYVVEIIYLEEKAGGMGDGAYDRLRHVSTLSFTSAKGLPWKAQ